MSEINFNGDTYSIPLESFINNMKTDSTITLKLSDYINLMKKIETLEEQLFNMTKKNIILTKPKERAPASP